MEKKLEVKNLKISFRTANGKVQAVRNISFDMYKGETLAIVGESGSGKSVTSKSMLGILAGNAMIEGGEILYDGKDLLKCTEDDFYHIRGDKIAMIFQDPMSSLNPIMRIGKQLTEAMILKGKARRRSSRKAFNTMLSSLEALMVAAITNGGYEEKVGKLELPVKTAEEFKAMCQTFNKFEVKHTELELLYNTAKEAAVETLENVNDLLFHIEKNAVENMSESIRRVLSRASIVLNEYVVSERYNEYALASQALYDNTETSLLKMKEILEEALKKEAPNFFRMGYYVEFSGKELPNLPVKELDEYLLKYLMDNFMTEFLAYAEIAIKYSAKIHDGLKQDVLDFAKNAEKCIMDEHVTKKEAKDYLNKLSLLVESSIDKIETQKDNIAYTFRRRIFGALDAYYDAIQKNKKAQKAHDKEQAKFDKIVAKGKTPDWKVVPLALIDLDALKEDMMRVVSRLAKHYEKKLQDSEQRDFEKETVAVIDYLKQNASDFVNIVTKAVAKHRAIKLMEEVGIDEAKKRFKQYPFEFSGGMRQRMVIAIALAANPDILICDEPTTALDVTIQAQILELINKIKEERKLSILFITHDLGVVANMADRIAVMYAGKIVEYGTADDVFYSPAHPYTWALLSSMPDLDTNERLEAIPGTPPNMIYPPVGDAFAERNKYALEIDYELEPPMFKISDTHSAATWLLHPDAPKVDIPKVVSDRIARMKARGEAENV